MIFAEGTATVSGVSVAVSSAMIAAGSRRSERRRGRAIRSVDGTVGALVSQAVGGGLDQLDEDAAGALRVHEVHA